MRPVRDRIRGWFVFTMVVTLALLAVSACGGATTSTPTTASATPTMGHGMSGHGMGSAMPTVGNEFQAGMLVIRNVWARPATEADGLSAVYMVIENTGDQPDLLLRARCRVAADCSLIETKIEGGVMKMQPVDGIDIPAKGTVELKPRGLYIALFGLRHDLNPGDEIELELQFDNAGRVPVKAVVQKP
jgi:copper(I)-binding protein